MKKELLDLIKELSLRDPKTLSQKVLKTTEEVGELAKAVLAFENAPQNTHRFSDKQKILEEAIDTMLGALSSAYNVGFESDAIEAMLAKKTEYWAGLQAKERKNPFPLPFEIHVTVDKSSDIEQFNYTCSKLGIKAICLDLIDYDGNAMVDEMMSSSRFFGNNLEAYEELIRISKGIEQDGFKVVRQKIETTTWHPVVPSKKPGNKKMKVNGYFESHIDIFVKAGRLPELIRIAKPNKAVISHNVKKTNPDGSKKIILTIRAYKGLYEDFKEKSKALFKALAEKGFNPDQELIEFALYDTNVTHDESWISKTEE